MDRNIQTEKAKSWLDELENELEAVHRLLMQVAEETMQKSEEDDTIMNAFYDTGKTLQTAWNALGTAFRALADALREIIRLIEEIIQKLSDQIDNYTKKIRI